MATPPNTNPDISSQLCVVLSKNAIHPIASRMSSDIIRRMAFEAYGTGKSVLVPTTLHNGVVLDIRLTNVKDLGPQCIGYTGEIANGSEIARVRGTFDGVRHGSLRIVD